MHLRPYQQSGIDSIYDFFLDGGLHCIRQSPTGSGKTIEFTQLAKMVSAKNKKILIMTDRAELLYQAGGSLKRIGLNAMYIQAGAKIISKAFNCYIAMSQTLRRRIELDYWKKFLQSIDLLILDECHKQEFNYIFESTIFDNKHVIGFTATPRRTGKMRQLAFDYTKILEGISVKELINQDYLVNDDYYGFGAPDMSDVVLDPMKGDYQEKSMFQKFNNPTTYAGAVKNYQEICPGTPLQGVLGR